MEGGESKRLRQGGEGGLDEGGGVWREGGRWVEGMEAVTHPNHETQDTKSEI